MSEIKLSYTNPLKARFTDEFFASIPSKAGVYFFLDATQQPIYIGKAVQLKRRLQSYRNAKPGQAMEHILEMIEFAESVVWEVHPNGDKALARESELIRSVKPKYNIAGKWELELLQIGLSKEPKEERDGNLMVEFRLSNRPLAEEFEAFGCYIHRAKTKSGYSALLRLLHVGALDGQKRFHSFPSKLCRAWPLYQFQAKVPKSYDPLLRKFLRGETDELLRLITSELLSKENIPPYLYGPIQRDIQLTRDFFEIGPKATRQIQKRLKSRSHYVSQAKLKKFVFERNQKSIEKLSMLK